MTNQCTLKRTRESADRDLHVEFDFLGVGCNHSVLEQLEAKNLQKLAVFDNTWLFLRGFWLLAALKEHGRTQGRN